MREIACAMFGLVKEARLQSGHESFIDEPDKFNDAMAELVRPLLPSDPPAPELDRRAGPQST